MSYLILLVIFFIDDDVDGELEILIINFSKQQNIGMIPTNM